MAGAEGNPRAGAEGSFPNPHLHAGYGGFRLGTGNDVGILAKPYTSTSPTAETYDESDPPPPAHGRVYAGRTARRHRHHRHPDLAAAPGLKQGPRGGEPGTMPQQDRKSTRLNSSHSQISYAVFCLKKKNKKQTQSANIKA